jgi:hypothetical protein
MTYLVTIFCAVLVGQQPPTPEVLERAARGEHDADTKLRQAGYKVVDGPSTGKAMNANGPDVIAVSPQGDVILVDNKALGKRRPAGGVKSFLDPELLEKAKEHAEKKILDDPGLSSREKAHTLAKLRNGQCKLVITACEGTSTRVTSGMANKGVEFWTMGKLASLRFAFTFRTSAGAAFTGLLIEEAQLSLRFLQGEIDAAEFKGRTVEAAAKATVAVGVTLIAAYITGGAVPILLIGFVAAHVVDWAWDLLKKGDDAHHFATIRSLLDALPPDQRRSATAPLIPALPPPASQDDFRYERTEWKWASAGSRK